ncbi:acyl carrier protein [Pseudomonas sp. H9]|uniref:acyl carrier protein n=1 Tax=Pseudomonas sp. H9 TaxID=483968 RepID=UPI0015B0DDC4|nr:acyl carrier protein [Pseudomonas sp. H9]
MDTIEERVKKIIVAQTGMKLEYLTEYTLLDEDCNVQPDSIELTELGMALEEEFEIEDLDEIMKSSYRIRDLVSSITRELSKAEESK